MSNDIRAELAEQYDEELLFMDGFDEAVIGVVEQFGREPVVCYDITKVLAILVERGMTMEEAWEYHEFKQLGAYVGERTPCFLNPSNALTEALP
jgi:hypothetical protein